MTRFPLRAALAALFTTTLLGCSTTAPTSPSATPAANASAQPEKLTLTGSRIPAPTTDRMMRQIDNAQAREMERDRPPMPLTSR